MSDLSRPVRVPALDPDQADAVAALVDRAEQHDGVSPLNEAATLALRHPTSDVTHLLLQGDQPSGDRVIDGGITAYAQVALDADSTTGYLVVDPAQRRSGHGRRLITEVQQSLPDPHFWAFGDLTAARGLARAAGLVPRRTLLRMQRPLAATPPLPVPDGITIRAFVVGQDDAAWLDLNARAFAHHPEQGRMTGVDLALRMSEPWFDPRGFLLAVDGETLAGFHWTKQHPDHLGEVYVLAVDPAYGGKGLGRVLLRAGLTSLAERGSTTVELYVEGDAARAVDLYAGDGFATVGRDVMYAAAEGHERA